MKISVQWESLDIYLHDHSDQPFLFQCTGIPQQVHEVLLDHILLLGSVASRYGIKARVHFLNAQTTNKIHPQASVQVSEEVKIV